MGIYQFLSYKKEKNVPKKVVELLGVKLEEQRTKEIIEAKCLAAIAEKYKYFADNASSIEDLEKIYKSMKGGQ